MSSITDCESFWDIFRRSRILPEDRLQELSDQHGARSDLASAESLADELVDSGVLTRWQAGMLLKGKHRGFVLGSYRLIDMLGKGGMGSVYLAEHAVMRRRCAVKVLPSKRLLDKASVLDRFHREAQAVAALDHPNIVRAYDVTKVDEGTSTVHILVMEFIQGADLQSIVQEKGVLDFVTVVDFIRQAAEGLSHAHAAGLVHRDIKPANLMIDNRGILKILDLGLARFSNDQTEDGSLTRDNDETVLGTADYLAPEQAKNSHEADSRADIYGLGCVFYFGLTGHAPFPEGTITQRLLAHQNDSPESILEIRPNVPEDFLAIHEKMTKKDPADRFQAADQVAKVMSLWLQHHADKTWLDEHPEITSERYNVWPATAPAPTRAISSATDDTELTLLPDDETSGSDSSVAGGIDGLSASSSGVLSDFGMGNKPLDDDVLAEISNVEMSPGDSLDVLLQHGPTQKEIRGLPGAGSESWHSHGFIKRMANAMGMNVSVFIAFCGFVGAILAVVVGAFLLSNTN